jgi:ribosomal protein S24E
MSRTNLFFKVELEHEREENPQRIGDEIRRHLLKMYGVREAELTNFTAVEE